MAGVVTRARRESEGTVASRRLLRFVAAKVACPGMPPTHVSREGLRSALVGAAGLALVSAPAGTGKTTLLAEWVQRDLGGRAAWLSIDRRDNDPVRFWMYVLAAIQTLEPDLGIGTLDLLSSRGGCDSVDVAEALVAELGGLDAPPDLTARSRRPPQPERAVDLRGPGQPHRAPPARSADRPQHEGRSPAPPRSLPCERQPAGVAPGGSPLQPARGGGAVPRPGAPPRASRPRSTRRPDRGVDHGAPDGRRRAARQHGRRALPGPDRGPRLHPGRLSGGRGDGGSPRGGEGLPPPDLRARRAGAGRLRLGHPARRQPAGSSPTCASTTSSSWPRTRRTRRPATTISLPSCCGSSSAASIRRPNRRPTSVPPGGSGPPVTPHRRWTTSSRPAPTTRPSAC